MHDDHKVIDYLLEELNKHGASQFDVSKELEVRFGTDFANKLSAFYERSLEYYDLAKTNPENGFIEPTSKGHEVIKNGGWLSFQRLEEIDKGEAFKREVARRDKEASREEAHERNRLQKTQNMAVAALIIAVAALVISVVSFLSVG